MKSQLLAAKLENLRRLKFSARAFGDHRLFSDGSTDSTAELLKREAAPVRSVILTEARGKEPRN